MEEYTTTRAMRFVPQMVAATLVVAVVPVALAWWLRAGGLITSGWLCVVVAMVVSLALSAGGSFWWTRRGRTGDILFSELLLWGWLRRYRVERQLVGATSLLGLLPGAHPTAGPEDTAQREQLLRQLSTALDAHDPYLDGHSRRVSRYSATVARRMGLPDAEVKKVRAAAAVHDVGKLRVPPELLRKATPLTDAEFEAVMRHAEEGAEMVAPLGDRELTEIVRHHHERFDGLGYPDGLRGGEIPLGARIVAVSDTFDAITSARPYRPAARHKQAIDALIANAGSQLDPDVVRAFLRSYAGRRASVLWVIVAVSPQRAFAWMHRVGHGGPAGEPVPVMPVGELAAGTIGRALVVAAAVGTSVGVGVARYENRAYHPGGPLQVAAAAPFSPQAASGVPGKSSASQASSATGSGPKVRYSVNRAVRPAAKRSRARVKAARTAHGSPRGSAPGSGSSGAAPSPGSGSGSSNSTNPSSRHGTPPSAGHASPLPVTAPASTVAAPAPVAALAPAAVNAPSSTGAAPSPSPSPPSPPPAAGGGGGTTGGGGAPGHGGPGGPPEGPGGGGPRGHFHGGPGDGGWGPGGNPDPGGPHTWPQGRGVRIIIPRP